MIRCPYCGREFEPPAGKIATAAALLAAMQPAATSGFVRRYKRPVICTPVREQAVLDLCLLWSQRVRRLTVVSQTRFSFIHARLSDGFQAEACRAAITAYADDPWHKEHPTARLELADFFAIANLEKWIQEAADAQIKRERAEHAKSPQPAVRRLCKAVAGALSSPSEERQLRDRFTALPQDARITLLERAVAELKVIRPGKAFKPDPEYWPVMQQVIAIMRRERSS